MFCIKELKRMWKRKLNHALDHSKEEKKNKEIKQD